MSGTLQEYLINIRYNVDAASQSNFLGALQRAATSVSGVAAELIGLAGAITLMTEKFADAGERLHFMSLRLGSSIADLQNLTATLTTVGVAAGEATGSLEAFGNWTRSQGPAATAWLGTMGVTATDTAGRLRQLHDVLRRGGFAPGQEGTWQYAFWKRQLASAGISETTGRGIAADDFIANMERMAAIQERVWGGGAQAKIEQYGKLAHQVQNEFRFIGTWAENMQQKFAAGLFAVMLKELQKLSEVLFQIQPQIERFLEAFTTVAVPPLMHFLEGAVKGFGALLQMLTGVMQAFHALPDSVLHFVEAITGAGLALRLFASPMGRMLAGLAAIGLLLEDFAVFQSGGIAAIDWDKLGDKFAPLTDAADAFDRMVKALTGIEDASKWLMGGALLLMFTRLGSRVSGLVRALLGLNRALPGAGAAGGGGLLFNLLRGTIAGIGLGGSLVSGVLRPMIAALGLGLASVVTAAITAFIAGGLTEPVQAQRQLEQQRRREREGARQMGNEPQDGLDVEGRPTQPTPSAARSGVEGGTEPALQQAIPARPPETIQQHEERLRRETVGPQSAAERTGGYQTAGNQWVAGPSGIGTGGTGGLFGDFLARRQAQLDAAKPAAPGAAKTLGGDLASPQRYLTDRFSSDLQSLPQLGQGAGAEVGSPQQDGTGGGADTGGGGAQEGAEAGGGGGGRRTGGGGAGGAGEAPSGPAPDVTFRGSKAQRAASIRDALMRDLNISREAAAGLVGNLQAESGLQAINERHPVVPGSRGGFGWAQWTGPRRVAFERYAAEHGLDPKDDRANYGFLVHELKTKFPGMLQQMQRGNMSAAQAGALVEQKFEAPLVRHPEARGRLATAAAALPSPPEGAAPPLGMGDAGARQQMAAGAQQQAAAAASKDEGGGGGVGGGINQTNQTTITVSGAGDPNAVAAAVGREQTRVNENYVRLAKAPVR